MKSPAFLAAIALLFLAACGGENDASTSTAGGDSSVGGAAAGGSDAGGDVQGGSDQGGNAQGGSPQGGGGTGGGGQGGGQGGAGGAATYSVHVDVSGLLTQGLEVTLNASETLTVDANGDYTFSASLADSDSYDVTAVGPRGEQCAVSTGSGTIGGADVTADVACAPVVTAVHDNASNWNDYLSANGQMGCVTVLAADYDTCMHAGERLFVYVPGATTCADLSAVDALDAFGWTCDDSQLPVRMLTTGLRPERGLTDLVDFTAAAWRDNSVTVSDSAASLLTTTDAVWWQNPVTDNLNGGNLDAAGTVYLATASSATAVVVGADQVALAVEPGVVLTGGAATQAVLASQRTHLWLEGAVSTGSVNHGVRLEDVRFSMIRGVSSGTAINATPLLHLMDAHGNRITRLDTRSPVEILGQSHNTELHDAHFSAASLTITTADDVRVRTVRMGGGDARLDISNGANRAIVSDVRIHNTTSTAPALSVSSASARVVDVIVSGSASMGIYFRSVNGVLLDATSVNNAAGIMLQSSTGAVVSNVTTANNTGTGMRLSGAPETMELRNLISTDNWVGIYLTHDPFGLAPAVFTGVLKVGNSGNTDCLMDGGFGIPSPPDIECDPADYNAGALMNQSVATSFVGKVSFDDGENASDTNGTATAGAITDFTHFGTSWRAWGIDGNAFPASNHHGPCTTRTCRIWEWALRSSDGVVRAITAAPPDGDDTLTAGTVTFLADAVEILGDSSGDDDLLCESGEACWYSPNAGAYQGHAGVTQLSFTDGAITGVTLQRRSFNGYIVF